MKRSLIFAIALLTMAPAQQVLAQPSEEVARLLAQDERLARVAERLLAGNASLCRNQMPLTGMVIHSQDQYAAEIRPLLFANGTLAVAFVLPGSPAEQAGVIAGDGLAAIAGAPTSGLRAQGKSPVRDAAFDLLAGAWTGDGPLRLTLQRQGQAQQVALQPVAGCRVLVEVRSRNAMAARSDGRVIQVDFKLIEAANDEELAVIFAHELGHVVLEHRRRLEAAGVAKGFFGEFGRNRRLNRQVEVEADRISVHLLANGGFDPATAAAFWRGPLSRRVTGALSFNTIYPSREARARLIEQEIAEHLPSRAGPSRPEHLLALRDLPFQNAR